MQLSEVTIRSITPNDLGGARRLSDEQDWNQTEHDWRFMIEQPENICLLAEYEGKIIGTTTAISYNHDVVWISMVLVDKAYRGHGVSKILLESILKQLTYCKSIKLDATPEGQRVYKGFHFMDEYLITRMTLNAAHPPAIPETDLVPQRVLPDDLSELIAFDQMVFGARRDALIRMLYTTYPDKAWLLKNENNVTGFALGRDGRRFHHIGPVMASSSEHCRILIAKALGDLIHQPVVVDVLNDKPEVIDWLTQQGFTSQRHFVRMYRAINPFPGNIARQYLICGPEFG